MVSEKICMWEGLYVVEMYGSVQRCKSHLPSCDAPPRGCDGIYIRALPCQPLCTGNGISSSLRLVERSFFVRFSWLLFWCWVAFKFVTVLPFLQPCSLKLRRFHFIQSLASPGYSCWSKNDRLSWVQTCDCLTKSFLKLYKTRTECTVSGNNLDRRSCSLALAPFCPCPETFQEAPVDTSDLRIVLKLPFKNDPACSK